MRDSDGSPERLRDLIAGVGPAIGLKGALQTGVIWRRWPEIVGPGIADHAEPTSLREGVLRVRVASPAWATEIGYLADEIKERANRVAGADLVAEVRVWSGPGTVRRSSSGHAEAPGAARDQPSENRHEDPIEAFDAAHEAWARRRARGR